MTMEATPREVPPAGVDMDPVEIALLKTARKALSPADTARFESVRGLMRFFGFRFPV